MGYQTMRFGKLYMDETPQLIPEDPTWDEIGTSFSECAELTIRDCPDNDPITWVKPDGMNLLIADRVLMNCISWDDLAAHGFVQGKEISIGPYRYRCRLLQVGARELAPNEWDMALNSAGDSNFLWHWREMSFWGQEKSEQNDSFSICRGGDKPRTFKVWTEGTKVPDVWMVGFRPALEPLPFQPEQNQRTTTLDGEEFFIKQMQGASEYDVCPQLQPKREGVFKNMHHQEVRMYTLLMDGIPVLQDNTYAFSKKDKLEITDTYYGDKYLIPWQISNGVAVASRAICAWVRKVPTIS